MKNLKIKGFTMIELLVVIAIIGALATIILASIASSRGKSNDTKTKSQIASLKRTLEVYGASNNNIFTNTGTTCDGSFADTTSDTSKFTNTANYPSGTTLVCRSSGSTWAVSASLSNASEFWCIDSEGAAKIRGTQVATTSC